MTAIAIDIVSDVVCPWCYVGKKRLEAALRLMPAEIIPQIRWHPFQLDPTIPPEGTDRKRYMAGKFGSPERVREVHRAISEAGRGAGIEFDFEAIEVSPNTLDAHRVLHWARAAGSDTQHRLAELLFAAYFEEGGNIGDPLVLAAAAREAGMDAEQVTARLASGEDRQSVEQEIEAARRMGVTGVPCFIIGRKYALVGAQEPEKLAEAISAIAGNSQ